MKKASSETQGTATPRPLAVRMLRWGVGALAGVAIAKFILDEYGVRTRFGDFAIANPLLSAIVIIGIAAGWAWATLKMLQRTDELDISDHLWSCTIAFCGFCLLVPAWAGLAYVRLIPEPGVWSVFLITIVMSYAAYLYRKLRIWLA